ncbi:MAG: response regulator [Nitrospina sp.]|nr:response regulator [Nitrospina sp.]
MNEPKILAIEDNKDIREALRDLLTFEGMQVIVAENGQEGIDKAKEHLPDLILCDIMMPIKNGLQVFDELRHNIELKDTPFIFLTAKAENDVRQLKLGADTAIITKPFEIDVLLSSIKITLKKVEERKIEKGRDELPFGIA